MAAYFKGSLSHQDLDELNIEIVRNTLYKNYLEDFHRFVNEDPEIRYTPTQDVMTEILEFEADRRSINITLNSFGTELPKTDRKKLYPNLGRLDRRDNLEVTVDFRAVYASLLEQWLKTDAAAVIPDSTSVARVPIVWT